MHCEVHGGRLRAALWFYAATAVCGWLLASWLSPTGPWVHPDPWWPLPAPMGWGLALASGLAGGASVAVATRWMVARLRWAAELHSLLRTAVLPVAPSAIAALALGSGLGEELLFRGALQPALGLLPASLLFGLLHMAPGRPGLGWSLWAALMGLLLGILHQGTGLLIAPITAHVTVNYLNLHFLAAYDPSPPEAKGNSGCGSA